MNSFYRAEQRVGVAVPALVWDIAEVVFARYGDNLSLSKLVIVKLVHDAWKLSSPNQAGLIQSKQFVEWFASNQNVQFK